MGQRWEGRYGGAWLEEGLGGVTPVLGGGFVAVGQSNSPVTTASDVYIIKTNNLGATLWSFTYDISGPGPANLGGDDFATDVKELPSGDFILTGYTYNRNTVYNDSIHGQIFLMKLDKNGIVQWTRTYGGIDADTGLSVALAGNGDIIVAGATVSFGAGPTSNTPPAPGDIPDRDAFILRTDANGNVIWMRTYGGEYFDGFRSVIELASGEIVAAGYSENFASPRRARPFVVRVDPAGLIGTIGYNMTGAVVINRKNMPGAYLNCIRKDPNTNTFIAVGTIGSGIRDVYILTLSSNLLTAFDYSLGQATQPEDGMWLDFDQQNGNLPVIVGTRANAAGIQDVWAFEINLVGLALVWSNIYGSATSDYGHSIAYVPGTGTWGPNPGFIMTGSNWGPGPLPQPQLYLIRSNIGGNTGCTNVATPQAVTTLGFLNLPPISPKTYRVRVECTGIAAQTFSAMDESVCLFCPACKTVADPDESITEEIPEPGTTSALDQTSLKVYPNPVAKEDRFNVEYRLLAGTEATVVVTDIAGKEIYRTIAARPAGEVATEIPVGAWSAGSYMVKVTAADGSSSVRQIVVGAK